MAAHAVRLRACPNAALTDSGCPHRCRVNRHSAFRYVRAGPPSPRNWVLSHGALTTSTGNSYRRARRKRRRSKALDLSLAGRIWTMNDLLTLLPATKSTWLLIVTCITGVAFTLSAIACDRLEHKLISPLLAAGAWLSAASAALVWFWR